MIHLEVWGVRREIRRPLVCQEVGMEPVVFVVVVNCSSNDTQ
jgi:hypothetical protein